MVDVESLRKGGRWNGKGAVYFPGKKGSYIKIDDGGVLNPNEKDYSIYTWFKPTTKNTRYILSKGDNKKGGYLFYSNTRFRIVARATNKKRYRSKRSSKLDVNKWHMAAMVIDHSNNELRMYMDGKLQSTNKLLNAKQIKKGKTVEFTSTVSFLIGGRPNGRRPFRGYIDEVEVFSRALSDRDISSAYEMGSP